MSDKVENKNIGFQCVGIVVGAVSSLMNSVVENKEAISQYKMLKNTDTLPAGAILNGLTRTIDSYFQSKIDDQTIENDNTHAPFVNSNELKFVSTRN